jgi:nicotinamidase-related amidase
MLLVIDIQERLLPHMAGHEELIKNTGILLEGMKALKVPVFLTEQYTKGLGETVRGVRDHLEAYAPMEKNAFSCCDDNVFSLALETHSRKNVVICGIETHVCVLQTAVDLIEKGYQPVIVEDCTSSRKLRDKAIAIERMRQEGAIISSYESILFELARISGTPEFKAISKLVK